MVRRPESGRSRRDFPRVPESLVVRVEFVRWNEIDPRLRSASLGMTSSDLSASGVGLSLAPHLGTGLIRQLLSGKKKARLAIELRSGETINVFGRLIWAGLGTGTTEPQGRAGFSFIDISANTFQFLREYVDSRLADTAESADSSPGLGPPR